jgi:hypothetical protein
MGNQTPTTTVKKTNPIELQTHVMVVQTKLTLNRNKKVELIKKKRKEVAACLEDNNLDIAKAKMDSIIKEEDIITVYDILGPLCEILKEKVSYLLLSERCPDDLRATVDTLIYSSTRMEIEELHKIRATVSQKYGELYISKANSNADSLVNVNIVEKLRVKQAADPYIVARLKQICREENIHFEFPQEIVPIINAPNILDSGNFGGNFGGDFGGDNTFGGGNNFNMSNFNQNNNQNSNINNFNQNNMNNNNFNQNNMNMSNFNQNNMNMSNFNQNSNMNMNYNQNFNNNFNQSTNNNNFNQSTNNNFNQNTNNNFNQNTQSLYPDVNTTTNNNINMSNFNQSKVNYSNTNSVHTEINKQSQFINQMGDSNNFNNNVNLNNNINLSNVNLNNKYNLPTQSVIAKPNIDYSNQNINQSHNLTPGNVNFNVIDHSVNSSNSDSINPYHKDFSNSMGGNFNQNSSTYSINTKTYTNNNVTPDGFNKDNIVDINQSDNLVFPQARSVINNKTGNDLNPDELFKQNRTTYDGGFPSAKK